jgi:hypothetical protein
VSCCDHRVITFHSQRCLVSDRILVLLSLYCVLFMSDLACNCWRGTDVHEIRLREAVRKARTEAEEEAKEKQRVAERRHLEEGDAVRAELALLKRRLEEAQREADNSKRKITLSKQDGKMEAQAEVMNGWGDAVLCALYRSGCAYTG